MMLKNKYPLMAICQHRMGTDGKGITTLVAGSGCPLSCMWCLNKKELENITPEMVSPEELFLRVQTDDLYFKATGGGITFGGGEPLLYPEFIRDFRSICPKEWNITVETSLSVPDENVRLACGSVDMFIVDCKDMDDGIYKKYTGRSSRQMKKNLSLLIHNVGSDKIIVRVPLIAEYNTEEDQKKSTEVLRSMGVENIDTFKYVVR